MIRENARRRSAWAIMAHLSYIDHYGDLSEKNLKLFDLGADPARTPCVPSISPPPETPCPDAPGLIR